MNIIKSNYYKNNSMNSLSTSWIVIVGILISVLHLDLFYYSHDTPKWLIYDLATSLFIFFSLSHKNLIQYSVPGLLALMLIYLMIISLWWAPHKVAGLEFLFRFINGVLLIHFLLKKYDTAALTELFLNTVFYSAMAFSLVFITERYIFEIPFNVGTFSPIGFINNTSAVFNIWIPGLVIFAIVNYQNKLKFYGAALTLIVIVGVLMEAGTRGAILGLTISELIVFLIVLKKNPRQAVVFLTITALLILGVGIYNVSDALQNGRLDAKLTVMKNNIGAAGEGRVNMIKNTWEMTKDNPFGVGVNNFEYVHPKYAKVGTSDKSPFVNENQILRTPHNVIVKILSELGFIGGILFVLLLSYIYLAALIGAFKGSFVDKWLFVGLSATLLHSMVSAVILTPVSFSFFILLTAVVLSRIELVPGRWNVKFNIRVPQFVTSGYLIIILLSFSTVVSEYYSFKGRSQFDGGYLEEALKFNPQNDRALLNLAQYYFYRDKNVGKSLENIDQFLELYPYHIAGLMMKAERHYQLDDLEKSNNVLDKLLEFYPGYTKANRLKQLVSVKLARKNRNYN